MDNTTKECRSSYCECEPGKCGSGRIDKRAEAAVTVAEPGQDEIVRLMALADEYAERSAGAVCATTAESMDCTKERNALEHALRVAFAAQPDSDDHNPVEGIGAEFVKAKASRDPRAVDTLVDALGCTLREQGFALVPLDEEEVSES